MLSCEVRRAGADVERVRAISEYRNLLKCTSSARATMLSCEVRRAGADVERCRAISEYRNLLKCTSSARATMLSCEVRRAGADVERCRAISEYRNLLKCTSNSSVNRHSNNTYYWKMAQSVVHGLYHFVHHVLLHCYQRFPVEQNGSDCRQAIAAILFYHGLQGSAGTVLMVITLSYGKWRNSTPHRIKTPSLVEMKL